MGDDDYVPVFSTSKTTELKKKDKKEILPNGPCTVTLDKSGRRGKQVILVENIALNKVDAKELMRKIQAKLACSGSFKDGMMIFNTTRMDTVSLMLKEAGLKVK